MEVKRIELLTQPCKGHVLPLAPHPPFVVRNESVFIKKWRKQKDSNL